jgi:hypothetical protein
MATYTPQQNDIVECQNQTVMVIAHCLHKVENMANTFLGGGGEHYCLSTQQIADEERCWQDSL